MDITAYMYNRKGENMKASFTTGEDGKYYFTLPEINGEWNLQLLSKYDDKAQDYFIGIDRNFSPDGRWLSPYETRQVEVDTGKVYRSALMEIDETPILMTKQNHVLKNVTVKAKSKPVLRCRCGCGYVSRQRRDGTYRRGMAQDEKQLVRRRRKSAI